MIDPELVNALLPPRTQVLQVQLLPFSLGHFVTLTRIDSPFISSSPFTPLELFASVRVCTLNWKQCQEFVADSEEWAKQFAEWMRKVGPVDYIAKAQLFSDYIRAGCRVPDYQVEERDGVRGFETWTPVEQRMRVTLMRELGLSDDEVMDRPLSLSWWDYLTILESEHACKILTAEERERADAMFNAEIPEPCQARN